MTDSHDSSIDFRNSQLSLIVWKGLLPEELSNGQVRTAMTAVIKRMFADGQNFNEKGFLTLGFNGKQPHTIHHQYTILKFFARQNLCGNNLLSLLLYEEMFL